MQLHAFLTLKLDGREWSALPPRNGPATFTEQKAGWAPEPVWTC